MDLVLLFIATLLVATAFVFGLLWLTQKVFAKLPPSINSKTTNTRVTALLILLGLTYFWLQSVEQLRTTPIWSLPFTLNLAEVIVLPIVLVVALRRIFKPSSNAT